MSMFQTFRTRKFIVADTNVWYYLSESHDKKLYKLLQETGVLCATPVNFLEISSNINNDNFNKRRNIANTIIDKAEIFLPDNEIFVKQSWGFECYDKYDWRQAYMNIAKANNFNELNNGYIDNQYLVVRTFNGKLANAWRKYVYAPFCPLMIKATNYEVPNYAKKIRNRESIPKLNDPDKIARYDSEDFINMIILGVWYRLVDFERKNNKILEGCPSSERFSNMRTNFLAYAKVFAEYSRHLATARAKPEENDAGDLENFIFLRNDNYILATAERKWINIGKKVCLSRILDIKKYI